MRFAVPLACLLAATAVLAQPVIERATGGTQCVADPTFMRLNHMDLLKHQRVLTVHAGMRNGKFSLKACVQCHASRETGSVAAGPTDFCVSCHSYAAVKIDCFECHASRPQGPMPHGPGGPNLALGASGPAPKGARP